MKIWNYTHWIMHYRIPVWDGLVELGKGRYELTIHGQTEGGAAIGGGERDYFRHTNLTERRLIGPMFANAADDIKRHQPDVVIVNAPPRQAVTWQIPKMVHAYGGVTVLWTKSHSYTNLPEWLTNAVKRRLYRRYDRFIAYGDAVNASGLAEVTSNDARA